MSSSALLDFVERLDREIDEPHSFMLVRNGSVIGEGWWSPYAADLRHRLYSVTKSFTSMAAGMAIADGRLSLEEKVVSFFSEDLPGDVSANLAAMEVRHLLTMTTGHAEDSQPYLLGSRDGNWPAAFLARPVEHAPGTFFVYDTGASHMVSAILQQRTGQKLGDYLRPRLFEPLGIDDFTWEADPRGVTKGGYGLSVRTEDIAAFGQLCLQKGEWAGRELVPHAWVEAATSKQVDNGTEPRSDWSQGYGYQFWRCRHGLYRGDGAFGQYAIVFPAQRAVLAMTEAVTDMQATLDLVWDTVLPALGDRPLRDDAAAQRALRQRLDDLRIDAPGGADSSPAAERAGGRTYRVSPDRSGIETMRFDFDDSGGATLTVMRGANPTAIEFGHATWRPSVTTLFGDEPEAVVASGGWSPDGSYTGVIRRHLTPFYYSVTMRFEGDRATVAAKPNAEFEGIAPFVLEGAAS